MTLPFSRMKRAQTFTCAGGCLVLAKMIKKPMFTTGNVLSIVLSLSNVNPLIITVLVALAVDFYFYCRSLSGEGNFNWRFVFPFNYMRYEDRIVFSQKKAFDIDPVEIKTPCDLTLQVWDNELVRSDKFLGKYSHY